MKRAASRFRRVLATCLAAGLALPDPAFAQALMTTPGEFRVAETGAATYSIAINVPPGVGGVEPKLSINMNSLGGNGRLGVGFRLDGFSAITRCGRNLRADGVNTGILYTTADKLCMDGQRLVLVSGTHLSDGAKYRTEREGFSEITAVGSSTSGVASFSVKTKSGLTMEYGATTDSRIEAQGKSVVAAWFLNKVRDTKGNTMAFTYTENNAEGDAYPLRIEYGGNDNVPQAHSRSVEFEYAGRPDATEPRYVSGSKVNTINRLTKIKSLVGTSAVSEYRLTYASTTTENNTSRLANIEQCGYVSSTATTCLPKTVFTWQLASGGTFVGSGGPPPGTSLSIVASGDFDGNGYTDLLDWNGKVYYFTGPNTWTNPSAASLPSRSCTQNEGIETCTPYHAAGGDFNGDGKADVIINGAVYLSTGSGFTLATGFASRGAGNAAAGDFNGDGKADVIVNGVASYSSGSGWSSSVTVGAGESCSSGEWGTYCWYLSVAVGDFDADGRADVYLSPNVYLSTGTSFALASTFAGVGGSEPRFASAGDFNGDGYADLLTAGWIRFSNGKAWTTSSYYPGYGVLDMGGELGIIHAPTPVGDYDGDGRIDIYSLGGLLQTSSSLPNVVTKISSGLGAEITITYKPLSDSTVYTQESGATWPIRDVLKYLAIRLVSDVATSSGLATGTLNANYKYGGAKFDTWGWGMLGLRWLETTDVSTGIKNRTEFSQTWPYTGMPTLTSRTRSNSGCSLGGSSNSLSRTVNTLARLEAGSGYGTTSSSYRYMPYLEQTVQESCDLNGSLLPTITTKSEYDSWGNVTRISVLATHPTDTSDKHCQVTENEYLGADTANWILGRLSRAKVTAKTQADATTCP